MDMTQNSINGALQAVPNNYEITNGTERVVPNTCTITSGKDTNSSAKEDAASEEKKDSSVEDPRNFTIPVYKKLKLRIYKPLIPLKLALMIWYGAGTSMGTFILVFFKQRGITLTELSIIYIITPIVQFVGPSISGIIADKIGRSKPVLNVNLLLTIVIVVGMLFAPNMNILSCDPQSVELKCHPQEFSHLTTKTRCDISMDAIEVSSCNVTCPENVTQYCNGQNLMCDLLERNIYLGNLSLNLHGSWSYRLQNRCYYNVTSVSHKNSTFSWCDAPHDMYCKVGCLLIPDEDCSADNSGRTKNLVLNTALLILYFTVVSITFRFLDVTSMILAKEHNADFGRERFFSVIGVLIITPIAGYMVDATTRDGEDKNYNTVFYFFIGMVIVFFAVIYKLEVQIRPPSQNMWKKSLCLLKNPDVIAFSLVLIILGTAWGFTKNFRSWYLEGMNSPSILLGLINSVSALYGLPFLLSSKWWVKKIGKTQLFVLGLLGHALNCVGYSLLYDPWLSLLIEATSIISYHLLWVAVIEHSHSIATEGLTATVISTAGGIHFSIGRGSGGFIGGLIMDAFGGRIAYRVVALICLTTAVLYAMYIFVRKTYHAGNHTLDNNGIVNTAFEHDETKIKSYVMKSEA